MKAEGLRRDEMDASVRPVGAACNDLQVMTSVEAVKPPTLGDRLRRARRHLGCSQFELASRLSVSQRHVSYVECDRARPSVRLLLAWVDTCQLTSADRTGLLDLAGFGFPPGVLEALAAGKADAGATEAALGALRMLLHEQEDTPAFVLDGSWNVLASNACGAWLGSMVAPRSIGIQAGQPVNLLDLLQGPDGFGRNLLNAEQVLPEILARARAEARSDGDLRQVLAGLGEPWRSMKTAGIDSQRPLLSRFRTPHGELALYSLLVTFGWPPQVGARSLRIEYLVPADGSSRTLLRREARRMHSSEQSRGADQ
ncbi:MAG: helix-turn-helix transcriptional regulator [Hydrogenophaga sp.]|nr:helix-turn-helix transcriptional regulator [Hydrogenophaga sp.]